LDLRFAELPSLELGSDQKLVKLIRFHKSSAIIADALHFARCRQVVSQLLNDRLGVAPQVPGRPTCSSGRGRSRQDLPWRPPTGVEQSRTDLHRMVLPQVFAQPAIVPFLQCFVVEALANVPREGL